MRRSSRPERSDMGDEATRVSLCSCGKRAARWLAIGAALFLTGVEDMSNRATAFESHQTGVAPEGWTATLTGSGHPEWTVEADDTAPSRAKVIKQSGRATFPLLLKNDY